MNMKLAGCLGHFQNCVHGGRVMCANNEKQFVEEDIEDLDANSLYPSAMKYFEGLKVNKTQGNQHVMIYYDML